MLSDSKPIVSKKTSVHKFYDSSFVTEYGKIESMRAARYNSNFSVLLMSMEGTDGRLADTEAVDYLRQMSGAVLESVRNCDVLGVIEDRQLVAILPETDYFGSLVAIRKISKTVNGFVAKENLPVSPLFSQATFPKDGKGYGALVSTAAKRLAEKKNSLWVKLELKDRLFWEIIGEITNTSFKGFENSTFDAGGGYPLGENFIEHINDLIIKEIIASPFKRGILYLVSKKLSSNMAAINSIEQLGTLSTKVFLVGQPDDNLRDIKNTSTLFLDDPRLKESFFSFYLSEDGGYVLICKENWGSTFTCFHSSDPFLVDGLINKFQIEYTLQEQL